jgi:hypothetical protein
MVNHRISHVKLESSLRNNGQLTEFVQADLANLFLQKNELFQIIQFDSINRDIQIHNEILHLPFGFSAVQEHFDYAVQNINAFVQAIQN